MSRNSRTQLDEMTLSARLQWHASQSLRHGIRCSVIVLQPLTIEERDTAACAERGEGPLEDLARRLRAILRRSDVIEVDPTVGIGVLLPDADMAGTNAVQARIMRDLGQRPSARGRQGSIEDVRVAIGRASAEVSDAAQLPAVVRDLVCVASSPDVWMCVPVMRPARRGPARVSGRTARGSAHPTRSGRARRSTLRLVASELGAAGAGAEGEALRRKADEQGVPFVRIPTELPTSLRRIVSPELARELCAVPIGRTRGVLTVAMRDSSDLRALQRLATATGLTIFPVLAAPDELARALDLVELPVARRPIPVPTA